MFCVDITYMCTDVKNNNYCTNDIDGKCIDLNQSTTNYMCKDPISGICKDMNFYTTLCRDSLE
jgi:hypothetical protein